MKEIQQEYEEMKPLAKDVLLHFFPFENGPFKEIEQELKFPPLVWNLKDPKGGYVSFSYNEDPEKFVAFRNNARTPMFGSKVQDGRNEKGGFIILPLGNHVLLNITMKDRANLDSFLEKSDIQSLAAMDW